METTHFADDATLKRLDELERHLDRMEELERQRDELYAALRLVVENLSATDTGASAVVDDAYRIARAALDKARG